MKNGTEEGEEDIPGLMKSTCEITKTRSTMVRAENYKLLEDNIICVPSTSQGGFKDQLSECIH